MRTVLASERLRGRSGRAIRAALNGVLLGCLSEDDLRRLDEHYYDCSSEFRSTTWNERGLWQWELEAVQLAFAGRSRIAMIACGGGRELLALRRLGFDAIGYEPHPLLREYAACFLAARGFGGVVRAMPRDRFPTADGPFDGVLVGWGAYSLIAPRPTRISFLKDAVAACTARSPLMLSVFGRPLHGRELRITAGVATALRALRRTERLDLGDTLAPNRVHVFTDCELSVELTQARLVVDSLRNLGPADPTTSYLCAVAHVP